MEARQYHKAAGFFMTLSSFLYLVKSPDFAVLMHKVSDFLY